MIGLRAPALALVFSLGCVAISARQPGDAGSFAPWTAGTLDIHHISTGRGNATFMVLPDGTTLLIDAGAAADGIPDTSVHPNPSRTPGQWIARYIRRHLPPGAAGLDYAVITHFHGDHLGQVTPASAFDRSHTYRLAGITEVAEALPIARLLDRGWPDYAYPSEVHDVTMDNYRRFADAQHARAAIDRFKPGVVDQVVLQHDRSAYPTFEVRNIIANGEVWTGQGTATRALFPPLDALSTADMPNENMCSIAIRLRYGSFGYFSGGDLPGTPDPGFPDWHAIERSIAPVVGPVDVHVVDQHGSMGEATEPMLRRLAAPVLIIPSWSPSQPAPDVLKRILNSRLPPSTRYVFATDLRESTRIVIGQRAGQLAAPPGHIVVRVEPGGGSYRVFVLTNRDESDAVVAATEPLTARSIAVPAR